MQDNILYGDCLTSVYLWSIAQYFLLIKTTFYFMIFMCVVDTRVWHFGFKISVFQNFSNFWMVSDSLSNKFGTEKSIGFGIGKYSISEIFDIGFGVRKYLQKGVRAGKLLALKGETTKLHGAWKGGKAKKEGGASKKGGIDPHRNYGPLTSIQARLQ